MIQQNISTQKTARYFTIGEANKRVKHLWICLHGYGQLAHYFGRQFREFEEESRLLVFPEGPHRFYLEGTSGRVGASWMTKEERLSDIADQFYFLEKLTKSLLPQLDENVQINVFGFSQGVATALRWIDQSDFNFTALVCWAGTFPPDIDYKLHEARFAKLNFQACFGDADEYISSENAQKLVDQLEEQNIFPRTHFYVGGHKIYPALLAKVLSEAEASRKPK